MRRRGSLALVGAALCCGRVSRQDRPPGLTEWLSDVAGLALGGLLIFMERFAVARPAPVVAGGAPEGRE